MCRMSRAEDSESSSNAKSRMSSQEHSDVADDLVKACRIKTGLVCQCGFSKSNGKVAWSPLSPLSMVVKESWSDDVVAVVVVNGRRRRRTRDALSMTNPSLLWVNKHRAVAKMIVVGGMGAVELSCHQPWSRAGHRFDWLAASCHIGTGAMTTGSDRIPQDSDHEG